MIFNDSPFQLTPPWLALGIVTPERLSAMRVEWDQGHDRNPEHYRWRAFRDFLQDRCPLDRDLATQLYALGEADPDHAMGESMMGQLLQLPECPAEILDAAASSGRRYLARIVDQRRAAAKALKAVEGAASSWRLLDCDIWRDGGSYSATLANDEGTVALLLQVGPWNHPREVHYEALFVSNGDDPGRKEAVVSAAAEVNWLHVLTHQLDKSSASTTACERLAQLASRLQCRADELSRGRANK
jgi:hypothetical protein